MGALKGHASVVSLLLDAKANTDHETASFKNTYLRQAGAYVPESYDEFGKLIGEVFGDVVK